MGPSIVSKNSEIYRFLCVPQVLLNTVPRNNRRSNKVRGLGAQKHVLLRSGSRWPHLLVRDVLRGSLLGLLQLLHLLY